VALLDLLPNRLGLDVERAGSFHEGTGHRRRDDEVLPRQGFKERVGELLGPPGDIAMDGARDRVDIPELQRYVELGARQFRGNTGQSDLAWPVVEIRPRRPGNT
jgi:hypothetical protein